MITPTWKCSSSPVLNLSPCSIPAHYLGAGIESGWICASYILVFHCASFQNINVTSTHLHGFVWYSQVLSLPVLVCVLLPIFSMCILTLCTTKDNICLLQLLESWTTQLLSILILTSYFIIELHDRKYLCIETVWKPFWKLLSLFHTSYDVRTSVIDSFATFFLLAHVKVLSVTIDLLTPTQVYQLGLNTSTFGVLEYITRQLSSILAMNTCLMPYQPWLSLHYL